MGRSCGSGERYFSLVACTVKVKPTTPLKKVFEAAEVRALDLRRDNHYVWIDPFDVTL